MIDPLLSAAARWPDAPALTDAHGTLTWASVLREATTLASSLPMVPGARVALLARESAATVVAIHAIRLAGGVIVPLHRRLAPPELADQMARSGTRVLAHDQAHADIAATLRAEVDLTGVMELGRPIGARGRPTATTLDPSTLGAVLFTSGTTATPRGVLLSHGALLASASAWNAFLGSGPTDHWLSTLSTAHVAGLGMVLRPLLSGARLTVHEGFDETAVRDALLHDGITLASLVPVQVTRLLDGGPMRFERLRSLLVGGAPVAPSLVRRATVAGLPVVTTYGLTEAASGVTALPATESAVAPGSVGRPLPDVRVRVVDDEGVDVGPDTAGTILVGGPTLATGYDRDPDASERTFEGGWLRTRDVGRLDEEGRLWVLDRLDSLIISGGENISPAEVEAALATHPGVADVAVFGRPDDVWGAVPVAAVVPRAHRRVPSMDELRLFARGRIAAHKLPRDVLVVSSIPRTPTGKVRRHELMTRLMTGPPIASGDPGDHVAHDVTRPDGALIHVEDHGAGPDVIVLLHATLSNARELRGLAARLANAHRVLSIDRRSSGASRMPPNDPGGAVDVGVHVEDVLAVLEAVAPGQRAVMVGHSFGGCVALEAAARHPERVVGVWLFEPPYLPVVGSLDAFDLATLGDRIDTIARAEGMTAAALAFLDAVRGPGTAARLPAAARQRLATEGRAAIADAALEGLDPDGLGRIAAPVVLGLGGRSVGPYAEVADGLTRRVPALTVERFPGLGHGGPVSQPGRVAPSIIGLARHVASLERQGRTEGSR